MLLHNTLNRILPYNHVTKIVCLLKMNRPGSFIKIIFGFSIAQHKLYVDTVIIMEGRDKYNYVLIIFHIQYVM